MAINKIMKRDGKVVIFDGGKIAEAIYKAAQSVGGSDRSVSEELGQKVLAILENRASKQRNYIPTIEEVQDVVEKVLIETGHARTAKEYILYRQDRSKIREEARKIMSGKYTSMYKKLSLNSLRVLAGRYLIQDSDGRPIESPEEMFERVARAVAEVERDYNKSDEEIEKFYSEFRDVLMNLEFLPAGRTLTNAGAPTRLVSNCIVLHPTDSMDGIFDTLKEAALLQQAGSGLGFPWHLLRPAGTRTIRSRGVASGPISFLRIYDKAFGTIKQQGRHGANMAVMSVAHPDILEFIHCKAREGDIRNFNISVALTDEFMEKVMTNDPTPWFCEWRGREMKPRRIVRNENDMVTSITEETMSAREIMDEIVSAAWNNGEPGVIFLDNVNRTNPLPQLGRIEACNPCVTGDTLVSTENGLSRIDELAEKYGNGGVAITCDNRMPIEIAQVDGTKLVIYKGLKGTNLSISSAIWKTGTKPIWKVETESGYELEATSDHKIMTTEGWVEVKNLGTNHQVLIQSGEGRFSVDSSLPFSVQNEFVGKNSRTYKYNFPQEWSRELGQFLGWVVGDGWIRDKEKEFMVGLTFGKNDKEILEYLKPIVNKMYISETHEIERERNTYHLNYGSKRFVEYLKKLGLTTKKAGEKEVPNTLFTAPKEAASGFLQGLFSSDGTVMLDEKTGNYYVRLTTKSLKLAKQVQLLLLNFGVRSRIYDRSRGSREQFSYITKKGEKRIYETDGILFEINISGKNIEQFNKQIGFLCNKNKDKLDKILQKKLRDENFVDRVKFVEYQGERDVYDLTEPATHSFIANGLVISNCGEQMLHDGDVCNLGSLNLDKFVKDGKVEWDRLKHATRTAVRMLDNVIDLTDFPVEKVSRTFRSNRRVGLGIMGFADMLIQLEVGYNTEDGYRTGESVMRFIEETAHTMSRELAEEKGVFPNWQGSVYGQAGIKMRNAALTSIAPTGSISMICDISSGIEPYFALVYAKSQIMGGKTLYYVNRHLEKALRDRGIYSEELMNQIADAGTLHHLDLPEDMKRIFAVALDIEPEGHMRMQSGFQKFVDNSISKTCNFPYEATKEDVRKAYVTGWQYGCKSLTVYRTGSREKEVLHLVKEKKKQEQAVREHQQTIEAVQKEKVAVAIGRVGKTIEMCPECDIKVEHKDGCATCPSCGWGACS